MTVFDRAELCKIVEEQLELLNLAVYIMVEGPVTYDGEVARCALSQSKVKASCLVATTAGLSAKTILDLANRKYPPTRDLYSLTRSAVEPLVNAAYITVAAEEVAERAIRHVHYASHRFVNRRAGTGDYSLIFSSGSDEAGTKPDQRFEEFRGRNNGSWTPLDVATRINEIGRLGGARAGSRFLGAYALNYWVASEIIHGSPFGVHYLHNGYKRPGSRTKEEFDDNLSQQVDGNLVSLIQGLGGYLSAFFSFQGFETLKRAEVAVFNKLLAMSNIELDKC